MGSKKRGLKVKLVNYTFDPLTEKQTLSKQFRAYEGQRDIGPTIIQFTKPLTRKERLRIQGKYDLKLTDYIPDFAYLENISSKKLERLSKDPLFRAEIPYLPIFKVSPTLGKITFRTAERRKMKKLWLNSVLFSETDVDQFVHNLEHMRADDIVVVDDRRFGGGLLIRFKVSKSEINAIADMEEVRWIDEVPESIEDNVNAAGTLQSGNAGNRTIWDRGLHGEGQIIGMMDSGTPDIRHCFLRGSFIHNQPGPFHRKVLSLRNLSQHNRNGHATFVAGCAAGDDLNNLSTHARRGGAFAARLVCGTRLYANAGSSMIRELGEAASDGARIHTNSWHDNTDGAGNPALYNQTAADVDRFTWINEDNLVLGSAGNAGEEQGPPGTAKNAICVGASQADPNEMDFGDGNDGPTADGRRKPDLMSPGCDIRSAIVNTQCGTGPRFPCATSYATPHAAAAAALARQYYTEGYYPTGRRKGHNAFTPSGALLKATLLNSTIDMTNIAGFPSNQEGWGLIRLDNVLFFPGSPLDLCVWDVRNADGITLGEIRLHHVNIRSNIQRLKVTLVWTDPPGGVDTATPVVNNLDLEVISPNGSQIFKGNVFAGGVSIQGGTADTINNVEMVLVNNPTVGNWTIKVLGTAVNEGDPGQGYALVVTADLCSRLAPISLKQLASDLGVNTPFSISLDLLPALGVGSNETVSLIELICEHR